MYLFGIEGIAYATVISYLIEKIMLVVYCKMEGIEFNKYTPVTEYVTYSLLTVLVYYISTQVTMPIPG